MKVISVANYKGGCSKTTTAVSLGACLAELGQKVLLIDLDPQLSATLWLGLQQDSRAIFDALSGEGALSDSVMPTSCKGLDAIPGSRWLIGLDKALATEIGAEFVLKRLIQSLPDKWDFIILDCPPSTGVISLNALCCSHELLIPLDLSVLSNGGLVHMLKTVQQIQDRLNGNLNILGILPSKVDRRTKLDKEIIEKLRDRFEDLVCKTEIGISIKMRECASFSKPITEYDPKGKVTDDYRKLAKELLTRIKKNDKVKAIK